MSPDIVATVDRLNYFRRSSLHCRWSESGLNQLTREVLPFSAVSLEPSSAGPGSQSIDADEYSVRFRIALQIDDGLCPSTMNRGEKDVTAALHHLIAETDFLASNDWKKNGIPYSDRFTRLQRVEAY